VDFKVLFSDEALKDLSDLVEFIAADNADAASQVGRSIIDHAKILQYFPRVGGIVSRRSKARKLLHAPYILYYRIHENRRVVEILHIWHGNRRPPKF